MAAFLAEIRLVIEKAEAVMMMMMVSCLQCLVFAVVWYLALGYQTRNGTDMASNGDLKYITLLEEEWNTGP